MFTWNVTVTATTKDSKNQISDESSIKLNLLEQICLAISACPVKQMKWRCFQDTNLLSPLMSTAVIIP